MRASLNAFYVSIFFGVVALRYVPFVGRMSYCYSKCLGMVLGWKGDSYPLPFLECLTTVPFGFVYTVVDGGGFAVNGYNPHDGVERALKALQYRSEFKCFKSSEEALSFLRAALEKEPILIGPVDMGFLVYDPYCKFKKGGDHYLVALRMEKDHVIVNDPDGYLHVPISIEDFVKAWEAEAIGYKRGSYSLWLVRERVGTPQTERLYKDALALGLQNLKERGRRFLEEDATFYTGPAAINKLAENIKRYRSRRWLRFYATFTFRVSAQRCFDSAMFIKEAPFQNDYLLGASETRMKQAFLYGKCQLEGSQLKFSKVAKTLEEISPLEDRFEAELEKGLSFETEGARKTNA